MDASKGFNMLIEKSQPGQQKTASSDWEVLVVDSSHTRGIHRWPE